MKFSREDYNGRIVDLEEKIPENEPVFLLRGQDEFASLALKEYCKILEKEAKLTNSKELFLMAKDVREQARQMLLWKFSKKPDTPK